MNKNDTVCLASLMVTGAWGLSSIIEKCGWTRVRHSMGGNRVTLKAAGTSSPAEKEPSAQNRSRHFPNVLLYKYWLFIRRRDKQLLSTLVIPFGHGCRFRKIKNLCKLHLIFIQNSSFTESQAEIICILKTKTVCFIDSKTPNEKNSHYFSATKMLLSTFEK